MININEAKNEFEKYVKNYDKNNMKIYLKINHSYRVSEIAKKIAIGLKLEKEDVQLAELIGLLHDIGRFEQLRLYNSYEDKYTIDHANFGVGLLFENDMVRKFLKEGKYDNIIYKAIKNHNKYNIEDGLNKKEFLHAKIIRDADKTDIYDIYIKDIEDNKNALFDYDKIANEKISPKVIETVKNLKLVDRNNMNNESDRYIGALAFIFDYNFKEALEIVKQKKYISKLINKVKLGNNYNEFELIERIILKFLEKV